MDSEQAGAVWSEFVANIVEGIDGSVFPRLNGCSIVHTSFTRCSMVYASPVMQVLSVLLTISTVIESNGSLSVLRMRESVCERCLSVMTIRRGSALVTASVLPVGCSASAAVCCADGLYKRPNEFFTNDRIKAPQTTEQNHNKQPKKYQKICIIQ